MQQKVAKEGRWLFSGPEEKVYLRPGEIFGWDEPRSYGSLKVVYIRLRENLTQSLRYLAIAAAVAGVGVVTGQSLTVMTLVAIMLLAVALAWQELSREGRRSVCYTEDAIRLRYDEEYHELPFAEIVDHKIIHEKYGSKVFRVLQLRSKDRTWTIAMPEWLDPSMFDAVVPQVTNIAA